MLAKEPSSSNRRSLRKSSFGLQRRDRLTPSEEIKHIFFGLCSDGNI